MSSDEADTYKCYATNEYGRAIVTATLNVIEGQYQLIYWVSTWIWKVIKQTVLLNPDSSFFSWLQKEQGIATIKNRYIYVDCKFKQIDGMFFKKLLIVLLFSP